MIEEDGGVGNWRKVPFRSFSLRYSQFVVREKNANVSFIMEHCFFEYFANICSSETVVSVVMFLLTDGTH